MKERCFGTIPLKKNKKWYLFLVKHKSGMYWGFPKGHREKDEDSKTTALRELKEETNLKVVRFITDKSFNENYIFYRDNNKIEKEVVYYLVEVKGEEKIQKKEIEEARWVELDKAHKYITYKESKNILDEVKKIIFR